MISEARRGAIRIASNYARLAAVVTLGLILTPLLLYTLGTEAYGVVALFAGTMSIALVMEEVVENSMIRELGAALHDRNPHRLLGVYNSAIVVSMVAAVFAALTFTGILLALPLFEIPERLIDASRWFLIAKMIESAVAVLLAPQFNMYLASERMLRFNFWIVMRRASQVGAATLALIFAGRESANGLMLYGWFSAGIHMAVLCVAAVYIVIMDRRLIPALRHVNRADIRTLVSTGGWNVAYFGSQVFSIPALAIIINKMIGVDGNTIFAIAVQLSGYVRMLAGGLTSGLEAVSSRLSSAAAESARSMARLVHHSTRLHAFVAAPAAAGMFLIAEPLARLWVGARVDNIPDGIPTLGAVARVLVLTFVMKIMVDNWTRILYGAGHIRAYAPMISITNVITPVVAIMLLLQTPFNQQLLAAAWALTAIHFVQAVITPWITAKALHLRKREVVATIVRPALVAIVCGAIIWIVRRFIGEVHPYWVFAEMAAYAVLYATLSWRLTLEPADRSRAMTLVKMIRNRLGLAQVAPATHSRA